MTTALYHSGAFRRHVTPPDHPERVERMAAVADGLRGLSLDRRDCPVAAEDDLLRCHPARHLARVRAAEPAEGWAQLDPDTYLSPGSVEAALRAVGGICAAVDAVVGGEVQNAFVAGRPPGHHAERETAMGFCLFGTAAIGAKRALDHHGLSRVAIVDFDVHHGNGTEDIASGDERILMVSFFQHPLYPYSGAGHPASNMVNLPVPAHTKGMEIRELIEQLWIPRLEAFKPEMIFISAGFDAHREDDLGQLGLTEQDYAWITERIKNVARRHAKGRIVSSLEGGYNLSALGRSVEAHIRVLADL